MWRLGILALILFPAARAADLDRDGLDDDLERDLLKRFAPHLEISANECAGLPAELRPGSELRVFEENGLLYGQVTPRGERIEIHYYHLWSRDCGALAHPFDAEHVSVLLEARGNPRHARSWFALYWYAAAHEDTLCDASRGIRAELLENAVRSGPRVWISRGKHASHLSLDSCARGCGGDDCQAPFTTLRPERIVNLGEANSPAAGAEWIRSSRWPLLAKFESDFPAPFLRDLENSKTLVAAQPALQPAQTALGSTGGAIDTGYRHTRRSLGKARRSVKNFFRRRL